MSITILLASFLFIFLAAAPGRTTFILIMLASHGNPKSIFIGASAAFLIQSLLSVLLGQLLTHVPPFVVEVGAGVLFVCFGFQFWKQAHKSQDIKIAERKIGAKSVFLVIFMAEFGDVSQLAIAAIAAESASKLTVYILAVMALLAITVIALVLGQNLKRMINPNLIQKIASLAFFAMGIILLIRALM